MSKLNGQPPINPNGAGWPSTTEGKSGSGRGVTRLKANKGNNLSPAQTLGEF